MARALLPRAVITEDMYPSMTLTNLPTSPETAAEMFHKSPVTGRMLIGGELVEASGNSWIDCVNPATDNIIGRAPRAAESDVEEAVRSAQEAQVKWAELPVADRSRYLLQLANAFTAHADELLMLEVVDSGNAITPMKADLANCVERLRYFAGLGKIQRPRCLVT